MDRQTPLVPRADAEPRHWQRSLAEAVRDPAELVKLLQLPESIVPAARRAISEFPLLVPRSYLARMEMGNPRDPLLLQVLPLEAECDDVPGFVPDAVVEEPVRIVPGLLQKYPGRALLIATGACAVHCRYCFRRHYPYGNEPRRLDEWEPAFQALEADKSIHEIILSGGDPLMLNDARLEHLVTRLESIPHLLRLRVHTRLPIVLPDRVTVELIDLLKRTRLQPWIVVHANHPAEIAADCADALRTLVGAGLPVLNQAVLLRGINDALEPLVELSERLVNLGVMPYYLHQLDRVAGAAHFEVPIERGLALMDQLPNRLPGYAVARYVQEIAGRSCKTPLK
ncbi:MAG: EF-P beta-lysylation protein EpmB [Planctomycetaceae bacterium]